jgi:hypothetical protein
MLILIPPDTRDKTQRQIISRIKLILLDLLVGGRVDIFSLGITYRHHGSGTLTFLGDVLSINAYFTPIELNTLVGLMVALGCDQTPDYACDALKLMLFQPSVKAQNLITALHWLFGLDLTPATRQLASIHEVSIAGLMQPEPNNLNFLLQQQERIFSDSKAGMPLVAGQTRLEAMQLFLSLALVSCVQLIGTAQLDTMLRKALHCAQTFAAFKAFDLAQKGVDGNGSGAMGNKDQMFVEDRKPPEELNIFVIAAGFNGFNRKLLPFNSEQVYCTAKDCSAAVLCLLIGFLADPTNLLLSRQDLVAPRNSIALVEKLGTLALKLVERDRKPRPRPAATGRDAAQADKTPIQPLPTACLINHEVMNFFDKTEIGGTKNMVGGHKRISRSS